jgi:inner membrane transporter RhtA
MHQVPSGLTPVSIAAGAAAGTAAGAAGELVAETTGKAGAGTTGASAAPRSDWAVGVALMTGSALSAQAGAAIATQAFPALGPAGVVAIRQWVASFFMLAVIRPRFWTFTARQWRPVLVLALVFAVMNVSLYIAIDRIGLGLAVTIEFLGPLGVAVAASRKAIDYACALLAGGAAIILGRPEPSTDYVGIGIAVLAAVGWAGYILTNRVMGTQFTGAEGSAVAGSLSALLYVPVGIWMLATHPVTITAVCHAALAGILCTVVPMTADLRALRKVPARFYSVFMSVNPLLAALIGLVVLSQSLGLIDWLAIGAIVAANVVSIAARG